MSQRYETLNYHRPMKSYVVISTLNRSQYTHREDNHRQEVYSQDSSRQTLVGIYRKCRH